MPNVDVDPPPWSSGLPPAVLRRLPSHADRVRFAASCRPWRAAASSTSHHQSPDPPPLPWLALPATGAFLSFPCSDETTSVKLPGAAAARYHGSCDDWLVFNHNYEEEYLLLNPFSGATARLPPLSRARNVVRHPREGTALEPVDVIRDDGRAPPNASVRKMAIVVTRPGRDRDRKAVVVVVVAIIGDKASGKVAACRLDGGGDGEGFWVVRAHEQWRALSDMAVHDGKVHVVDEGGDLYVVGVEEDERTGAPVITSLGRPVARAASAPAVASRHLVASGGKLLMVATRAGDGAFAVFEVDRRSARWKQVWSVGDDVVLFVGPWSSVARSVAPYEMRGNVIYFLDDDGRVGGYDMRDGKTTYNLSPAVPHGGGDTPATWLFSRGEPERGLTLCDVPSDVLAQQVLDRLPRHDQLSLRQVCRCLRGAVQQHCPPRRPPQGQAPAYLVRPDGTVFIHPDLTSLYLHAVAGYRGAACDGWLLFHDDDEGSLLRQKNLFTGRTRLLPSLRDVRVSDHHVEVDGELGRAGTNNKWGSEKVDVRKMVVLPGGAVAALLGRDRLSKLALCSSTSSSSAWAMSARDAWRRYEDMALCGGRLYALTTAEDLIAFDVITGTRDGEGGGGGPAVSRVELAIMGGYATPHHHDDGPVARYLVGSRATTTTMFMVRRPLRLAEGETAPRLEVFRADLASMRWEEVTTTLSGGDDEEEGVALFVGRLCSRAVRVRGGGGGDAVLRGDRVFFLPDDAAGPSSYFLHRVAVYDMRDGTVMELPKLKLWRDAPAPATWLFPEDDSPL